MHPISSALLRAEKAIQMHQGEELRVLVVEDNHTVRRVTETVLARQGWSVTTANDGIDATQKVKAGAFDVIVSDINMPGSDGLEFLRCVREQDLDVPVILMTGEPCIESSIRALEYGAFRYLVKPVFNDKLLEVVRQAERLHKLGRVKRQAQAMNLTGSGEHRLREGAALEIRFARSLELMWPAFQPIVSLRDRSVFGCESLLRSDDVLMNNPMQMLDAAERLGRVQELGRKVRASVAASAETRQLETMLFVNLHSSDLNDEDLYSPSAPLSRIAHRVVLEITERASLYDVKDVNRRIARLKAMGFRIAIDDLGAGYAGLTSFTLLEPEFAKLDMTLIRGIDTDPKRQCIVRSMKKLCDDLGIKVVAEGIETLAERDMLASLGCDLLQGYLFAKPARSVAVVRW
jgi:EAL domain-containing protein (putative c-di-GMP-specific phosphodiesterase class I)/CheY-like chemotaxis protein